MLTIDGSMGEGGGQILRTALALALHERRAFRIVNIRARRPQPGLRPQHAAAVRAAAEISGARVDGAAVGSRMLTFAPGPVAGGRYRFAVGTAGSTSLVLQTVLPALLTADRPSDLELEGGTHNPRAPTFEFLARAYLPVLARMGARVTATLVRHGFEPAGGGVVRVHIDPIRRLQPLRLDTRGAIRRIEAEALSSRLPAHVGEREAVTVAAALGLPREAIRVRRVEDSDGPGNVVTVVVVAEEVTEVFTAFGRRGVPAEQVGGDAAAAARRYLDADVVAGPHLADQLLLPLALAGEGSYTSVAPTEHSLTNIRVIREFLPIDIRFAAAPDARTWRVTVPLGMDAES